MNIYDFISPLPDAFLHCRLISWTYRSLAPYNPHELHVPRGGAGKLGRQELQVKETPAPCTQERAAGKAEHPTARYSQANGAAASHPQPRHLWACTRVLVLCGVCVLRGCGARNTRTGRARASRPIYCLRRDRDAQQTGAASTSAEETHLLARDRFTPMTQRVEVRRP